MESEHFYDFDAFAESVRGVESRMMLQNPRRHSWRTHLAYMAGVRVQMGQLGSGNIVEGQTAAEGCLLYLPLTDECEYSANGLRIAKDAFMILEPGSEFCVSTKFEHDWCTIAIPAHILDLELEHGGRSVASQKAFCRVTLPDRRLASQFRNSVREILATAAQYPQFESALASSVASASLLKLGARIVDHEQQHEAPRSGRPKLPRSEIIRRSRAWLEEHEGERVNVRELAAAAEVSERTLRTAFNERYGVGPVRYLQLRSLHQIYRALREADAEETTVAETLFQHGEWELGRFAARYRQLFGELPSETLRATRW